MACDARWPRAERGGQMSLYGCLSAEAVVREADQGSRSYANDITL